MNIQYSKGRSILQICNQMTSNGEIRVALLLIANFLNYLNPINKNISQKLRRNCIKRLNMTIFDMALFNVIMRQISFSDMKQQYVLVLLKSLNKLIKFIF